MNTKQRPEIADAAADDADLQGCVQGIAVNRMKNLSKKGAAVAALLPASALALFYSLAIHMYLSLGHWPYSIGYRGFSPALISHGKAQYWWISVVVGMSICLWPPAFVLCAAIPKARRFVPYLAIYAFVALACFGLMHLAPRQFLDWWYD